MNSTEKPLILSINEAQEKIISILNDLYNQGLSYFLMEACLSNITTQIHLNSVEELKKAQRDYANSKYKEDNSNKEETTEEKSSE